MSPSRGRPVANPHKVPKAQWRKWSRTAQKTFNLMMQSLRPSMQWAFLHNGAKLMARKDWQVTRWNVSWEAASIAHEKKPLGKVVVV